MERMELWGHGGSKATGWTWAGKNKSERRRTLKQGSFDENRIPGRCEPRFLMAAGAFQAQGEWRENQRNRGREEQTNQRGKVQEDPVWLSAFYSFADDSIQGDSTGLSHFLSREDIH